MGDRNNPIKFGPEWLRNLASEGHPSTSGGNNHTPMPHNSASGAGASGGGASGNTASSPSSSNASNMSPKVQLAKLRYGREEMLALYDRTSEAPPELKYIDLLYQTRGKPPFALNTFDDEMRDFARGGPPIGSMSPGERFGMSRGSPRGLSLSDTKPRLRAPFVRQPFAGRGPLWHVASPRMPGYSGGADDDSSNSRSSWSASNGGNHQNRNSGEQVEWTPNKQYRRRQGHANWRQAREEGEEWRSPDAGRSRPNQQDKWERDWGGPSQDRQSWNSNRRNWVGGDQNNEENLPEWAMENAEACGGTFDSSGAFHGYSNDDTNIPKSQDSSYPLTRSHTHGSFARSRTVEEGSEDWWASDKAKKLSPKRFDASDVKFRKQMSTPEVSAEGGIEVKPCLRKEIDKRHEVPEKESAAYEENASGGFSDDEKYVKSNAFKQNFTDSKTFEALMRSDINLEEGTDDRGNFQSVMINPNNSLRQKHQHMVPVASEMTRENMNMTNAGILHLLQNAPTSTSLENEMRKKQQQSSEDKIVEEIFDMTLDDKELLQKGKPISSPMMNHSITMCSTMASMANSMPQISSSGMQMRLSSQGYQGIPVNSKPNMPQGAHGLPVGLPSLPVGLQGGIQSGMQTMSSGYPIGLPPSIHQITGMQPMLQGGMQSAPIPGGMQPSGMQVSVNQQSVMSGSGIQTSAMQGNNMQQPQMQGGMQGPGIQGPGMQGPALSPGVQGGIPPSGMQQGGMPIQGMHGNMPPSLQGITNSALNASLGLPIGPSSNAMGVPRMGGPGLQGVMGAGGIQGNGAGMPSYPSGGLAAISSNNSLFMGQNSSNSSMGSTTDIPMPNHGSQSNMFSMNSLQHSSSQAAFNSMYSNLPPPNNPALADQWYYEDPEKNIQGPFTSKEMYNWYRAGFFGPNLLVRRACDAAMRPLGSYGPMDLMGSYPLTSGFDRSPGAHEMLNSQKGLCLDPVDSLWSQPTADMVWMQQALGQRQHNEARVNNLPLFFWEQQD